MKTYPEMDKEIVKLLDIEGTPFSVYDARCIEKLQAENAELRARLDKAEHRAEVAERALLRLCEEIMRDIWIIMCPSVGTQVRNKQELYDYCIEQAEKELAEEEKI